MGDVKKNVKLKTSHNKLVEYKHQGNIVAKLLVKPSDAHLNLKELMAYCLTPVPYCIATADGYLAKTDKSKSFSFLTKGIPDEPAPIASMLTIEDGNVLFY